jgi:DNA-binding winged helix-turn-helix (wHTH) protein
VDANSVDANSEERIRFNDFELVPRSGALFRNGQPVRIQPQPLRVLKLLLDRSGQTVSREELRNHIWGGATYVEFDQGLNYCIRQIRIALGDNAVNPVYIETLPKQGYRFVSGVVRYPQNGHPVPAPVSRDVALEPPVRPAPASLSENRRARWVVAAAAATALAAAGGFIYVANKPRHPELTYTALTDFTDSASAPVLSPDGRMLAFLRGSSGFMSSDQIYVKMLPNGESRRLTNDPRLKCCAAFSPDGSKVAYTVLTHPLWDTYTVSVLGGDSSLFLRNAAGLTWLDPQHLLFSQIRSGLHMGIVTGAALEGHFRSLYSPRMNGA